MSDLAVTLLGSPANNFFYESKVIAYRQMKIDDLRKEIERLAPKGLLDTLAYLLEPRRELAYNAAGQVIDERLRSR